MIELWVGIIVLTLLGIAFLCWPLLRKSQSTLDIDRKEENISIFKQRLKELALEKEQGLLTEASFNELKLELEKNLLVDAGQNSVDQRYALGKGKSQLSLVILLSLLLPAISLVFYAKYGSYNDLVLAANSTNSNQQPTLAQAITLLEQETVKSPDNPELWYMLAGNYMRVEMFSKGADAFEKVVELLPEESPQFPNVVGQYAQALFFIENKVSDKVKKQINRALAIDSQEVVSLGLLGIEAFEKADYKKAIELWEKSLVNAEPNAAQAIQSGIERARRELDKIAGVSVPSTNDDENKNGNKLKVTVDVDISNELRNKAGKDAVLFVFARPVNGRIPLAAVKLPLAELPKRVVLDDSLAMLPTAKISMNKQVEVSARVSLDGQAQSKVGDYESDVLILEVTEEKSVYKLLINKVVEE